jgi:hypothetical protein
VVNADDIPFKEKMDYERSGLDHSQVNVGVTKERRRFSPGTNMQVCRLDCVLETIAWRHGEYLPHSGQHHKGFAEPCL